MSSMNHSLSPGDGRATPDVLSAKRLPPCQKEPFSGFGFYDRSNDIRTQNMNVNIESQIDAFGFGGDSDDDYFSVQANYGKNHAHGDDDSIKSLTGYSTNTASGSIDSSNNQDTH